MNTRFTFLLLITVLTLPLRAQLVSFAAGYNYCYAPQWDKAVQLYNFSRPFLEEEQPLLIHGVHVSGDWFRETGKQFRVGAGMKYTIIRSVADNSGWQVAVSYHGISPAFLLQFGDSSRLQKEIGAGAMLGMMTRRINGELVTASEGAVRGWGLGPQFSGKLTYPFYASAKHSIHAFAGAQFSPWYFSPDTEAVLNQTKGMSSKRYSTVLLGEAGIRWIIRQ